MSNLKKINDKLYCLTKTSDILEKISDYNILSELSNEFYLIEEIDIDNDFRLEHYEDAFNKINSDKTFDEWKDSLIKFRQNVLGDFIVIDQTKMEKYITLSRTEESDEEYYSYVLIEKEEGKEIVRKKISSIIEYYSSNLDFVIEYITKNLI